MGHGQQAGVTAEGMPDHRLPFGVADAVFQQVIHAGENVVEDAFLAEVALGCRDVSHAVAGGCAKVRLEHDVAAVRHQMRARVRFTGGASERAAVDLGNQRRRGEIYAFRQKNVAVQVETVRRAPVHRQHLGKMCGRYFATTLRGEQFLQFARRFVEKKESIMLPIGPAGAH